MPSVNKLRFDGRVALVTGAGGGLGRAYALLLAERGCSVIVNDLGGSRSGEGASHRAADLVVNEIRSKGGKAMANYDSVEQGERIVEQAIRDFGRLDIVINNAGILRDKSFVKMTDQDWELVYRVHVHGALKVTKAAWEVFQRQKYGRIIMTASAAGLYGNFGQTNYGSAKMALVGFGQTLAKEGAKYNIFCNIVAPVAGSRITETVLPNDMIEKLKPEFVAPFVSYLCHESSSVNGSIYEVGAGYAAKVRWERSSPGALLKVDDKTFDPSAIALSLSKATNFNNVQYPQSMADVDWVALLQKSKLLPFNPQTQPLLRFDDRVVLVTGAGGGLGRGYALMFGKLGATVVVNDLGKEQSSGKSLADLVVSEIVSNGGKAIANYSSVSNGDEIINFVISKVGRIDILVNNAGILRDRSFTKMSHQEWDLVLSVHLNGTFQMTKAAWPHMLKQKYGRIINTCSAVGLYGNFGQANYSCAKAGILGFSLSLAAEGLKHNILVNTIAPNAGTQMTATILPKDVVDILKPEYVAPLVGFLAHESCQLNGKIFEVGSGWFSQVRWQRSGGYKLSTKDLTIESVASNWNHFNEFVPGKVVYPKNAQESFSSIAAILAENSKESSSTAKDSSVTPTDIFNYGKRDVILYNLGVGCTEKELKYVYEGDANFSAIPTFGVIPAFAVIMDTKMEEYANGFNPAMLLHGEHYLEMIKQMPCEGRLRSEQKVLQVLPKGKGCIVVLQVKTFEEKSGDLISINEGTIFLRNASPVKEINLVKERRPLAMESSSSSSSSLLPNRPADKVSRQNVADNQAAVYRLSGDYNPLHIDSAFAQAGGFTKPILHGLCTFGYATQHIIKAFANDNPSLFKAIKARFTRHVFPGETVQTEMWKINENRIAFQVRVVERDEIVISNAFVELSPLLEKDSKKETNGTVANDKSTGSQSEALFNKFEKIYINLPTAMKQDQVKKVNGIFQFDIKTSADSPSTIEKYFIDLKNGTGTIGKGKAPRPDITIIVKDADFVSLATGKMNGQQAFMKGLVQIRGNMMLAMKLDRVLKTLSGTTSSITKSKL